MSLIFNLSDFDSLFDEAFAARTSGNGNGIGNQVERRNASQSLRPRMDVHEDAKSNSITATFELPGLKKEDVHVDVHNSVLTISGESTLASDRDQSGYAIRERRYGKFSRSLRLPQGVKSEDIHAGFENGVLTVTFPRSSAETEPKKISIS